MADPIKERLERREQQHDLIREQVEIETLRDGAQQAATVRNQGVARSQDAAKTRGDLTRVAESTRSDAPKTDSAEGTEKPPESPTKFKVADNRGLNDLMAGRLKPVAKPPEATLRRADTGTQQPVRQPRAAAENARPSGATRIAQDRAVQGRREVAIAERPRSDQLPREQAHLRAGTPKPPSVQRLQVLAKIRAYVANLFKPVGPSTPEGENARQLQASVGQKKPQSSDPKNQLASRGAAGQPAGASASRTTGSANGPKEAGTPENPGHLFAFDGTTGDAETQACVADNRDAFCRLGAGESPLVFDAAAWNEVQRERSEPPHLRNTSTETTHAHRRVAARRGRGDRMTG